MRAESLLSRARCIAAVVLVGLAVLLVGLSGTAQARQVDCTRVTYNERIIINCVSNDDPLPTPTVEATPTAEPTATVEPTPTVEPGTTVVPTPESEAGEPDVVDEGEPDAEEVDEDDANTEQTTLATADEDSTESGADRGGRDVNAANGDATEQASEPDDELVDLDATDDGVDGDALEEGESAPGVSGSAATSSAVRDGFVLNRSPDDGSNNILLFSAAAGFVALGALFAVGARRQNQHGPLPDHLR